MNIEVICYVAGAIVWGFFIWIHMLNPYYLCKVRKYNTEMDKAVECSKVFWFNINPGARATYEDLLKYSKILEEELSYLEDYVKKHGLDNIGIEQDTNYKQLAVEEKINVLYSVFLENIRSEPYEAYFQQYNFKQKDFTRAVFKKVKCLKVYDDSELEAMNFLQYKLTKDKILKEVLEVMESTIEDSDREKYKQLCLEPDYVDYFTEFKINVLHKLFVSKYDRDVYEEYFQKRSIICEWKNDYVEENIKTLIKLTDEDIYSLGLKEYL